MLNLSSTPKTTATPITVTTVSTPTTQTTLSSSLPPVTTSSTTNKEDETNREELVVRRSSSFVSNRSNDLSSSSSLSPGNFISQQYRQRHQYRNRHHQKQHQRQQQRFSSAIVEVQKRTPQLQHRYQPFYRSSTYQQSSRHQKFWSRNSNSSRPSTSSSPPPPALPLSRLDLIQQNEYYDKIIKLLTSLCAVTQQNTSNLSLKKKAVMRLHINNSNARVAWKWLNQVEPNIFGFTYNFQVRNNVLKLKVQFLKNEYIPLTLLDHSIEN